MRPYLAIIRDSFREALASRVLWILLIVISLLLIALAPFSYRERVTIDMGEQDVKDWPQFIQQFKADAAKSEPSPARSLIAQMDSDLRTKVEEFKLPEEGDISGAMKFVRTITSFREGLNKLLHTPTFYEADAWSRVQINSPEAKELLNTDAAELSDDDRGRRNRLLLEAAYPEIIDSGPAHSLQLVYLFSDFQEPMPLKRGDFQDFLKKAITVITNWLVGVFGVFVAILVTAQIIPQTFDPGSLTLLLSKPILRGLVFLTKFVGGCAFILINAAYLVGGVWLILGVRFAIWDANLLFSIPIFMFMFAIYYSVSALTGVVWRNPIVCIALTIMFWAICFGVGWCKITVDEGVLTKYQITRVFEAGDRLLAVNHMGTVSEWDAQKTIWKDVFETDMQRQLRAPVIGMMLFRTDIPPEMKPIGPVYDPSREQLVTLQRNFRNGQISTYIGNKSKDWRSESGSTASIGSTALLSEPDGTPLVLSSFGIFRLVGNPTLKQEPVKIFGFSVPLPGADPYRSVGPETGVLLTRTASAALNQQTGHLLIYSRGSLYKLVRNDAGTYDLAKELTVAEDNSQLALVATEGDSVAVCFDDGKLVIYDLETLSQRAAVEVDRSSPPRMIAGAPGGKHFAILFHSGKLRLFDAETQQVSTPRVTGQGDISGVSFPAADRIFVVDRTSRVSDYDLPSLTLRQRYSPVMGTVELAYRYVLVPLYTVFPKPGELDKTVQYLLTGKETESGNSRRQELTAIRGQLHPWSPVWSGALFMAVTLGIGCLYIQRQEF